MRESLTSLFLIPGIIIEQEDLDATDCTASCHKTTSITSTTAADAATKANQHHNQGTKCRLD